MFTAAEPSKRIKHRSVPLLVLALGIWAGAPVTASSALGSPSSLTCFGRVATIVGHVEQFAHDGSGRKHGA